MCIRDRSPLSPYAYTCSHQILWKSIHNYLLKLKTIKFIMTIMIMIKLTSSWQLPRARPAPLGPTHTGTGSWWTGAAQSPRSGESYRGQPPVWQKRWCWWLGHWHSTGEQHRSWRGDRWHRSQSGRGAGQEDSRCTLLEEPKWWYNDNNDHIVAKKQCIGFNIVGLV